MPREHTMGETDSIEEEGKKKVVSVSVPPAKRQEFYDALRVLKQRHKDPFIQVAPLIVETIIQAAKEPQNDQSS